MKAFLSDAAERAYGFLRSQLAAQETEVIRVAYAKIRYPQLFPVDTDAADYAESVEWYTRDAAGDPALVAPDTDTVPLIQLTGDKKSVRVETYKLGQRYGVEALARAQMAGRDIGSEGSQELMDLLMRKLDSIAMNGNADQGWDAFFDQSTVATVRVPAGAGSADRTWSTKTADEIIKDVEVALSAVFEGTDGIYAADTIAIPLSAMSVLSSKRMDGTDANVLNYLKRNNIYTNGPGNGAPLNVIGVNELENAGDNSNDGRMVAYARDPMVLKLHLPLPVRMAGIDYSPAHECFLQIAKFRTGGLEVRTPAAMHYSDGITA